MNTNGAKLQLNMIRNIQATLQRRKMSQAKLASKCGIPPSTLSRIMNMHNTPTLGHCAQLAEALGIDPPRIFVPRKHS